VILTARGGIGFDAGGEMAHMNHLEPNLITALGFIGITRVHQIAIEGQEVGGELLAASVAQALNKVDALVAQLQGEMTVARQAQPA
jgi:FMN-dependent NADH-azoreductase